MNGYKCLIYGKWLTLYKKTTLKEKNTIPVDENSKIVDCIGSTVGQILKFLHMRLVCFCKIK